VKAWPIDPLVFRSFKLGVSEKLPNCILCGNVPVFRERL